MCMYRWMKCYLHYCAYQSAVPHAMILFVGEDSSTVAVVAEQLAVFRILRALKMVEKFHDNHFATNLIISLSLCLSLPLSLIDSQIWRPENYCSNSPAGISGSDNKHNYIILYTRLCV